jgi:recombination protein RecT
MSASNGITAQKQKFSVAITTDAYKKLISNTLQDPARAQRFVASITSAVAVNPALQECTPPTIIAGALLGESLNLSPSPQLGQYYLVPFKCQLKDAQGNKMYVTDAAGNKVKDANGRWIPITESKAQFVLGYKGYIQLAIRSGQYQDIDVMDIREGEYLGKDPQTGKPRFQFIEDDDAREKLPVVGYMGYFEYLNGFRKVMYWSKEKMMAHADTYSPAFSAEAYKRIQEGQVADQDMWKYSSFWYKNFDDMAKKTLLRQLISRWGIMSIEMQRGYVNDSGFVQVEGNGEFVSVPDDQVEGLQPQPEAPAPAEQVNLDEL